MTTSSLGPPFLQDAPYPGPAAVASGILKPRSLDESNHLLSARHEPEMPRTRDCNSHFWSRTAAPMALCSARHRLVYDVLICRGSVRARPTEIHHSVRPYRM